MKFHLSKSFAEHKAMRPLYVIAIVFVVSVSMAIYAYFDSSLRIAAGTFATTLLMSIPAMNARKFWQNNASSIELEITETELIHCDAVDELIFPKE